MLDSTGHRELLGVSVVYLGGLSYLLPVSTRVPVVSAIGVSVGELELDITPYVASQNDAAFEVYARPDDDSAEQQVDEFMDRSLQFRVQLRRIHGLRSRKHAQVSARYAFYREEGVKTSPVEVQTDQVSGSGRWAALAVDTRHIVDVSDSFVKYLASANLTIEIFGHLDGSKMKLERFEKVDQI